MVFDADVEDPLAKFEIDVELLILLGRTKAEFVPGYRSRQVSLRKVRPLVWKLWLGADQRDLSGKATVAQPRADRVSGGTAADDYRLARSSSRSRRRDQTR